MNQPSRNVFPPDQQLVAALFEQHPLAGFIVDPITLRVVRANKAALVFCGYSAEELEALDFSTLFHPLGELTWLQQLKQSGAKEWKGPSLLVKKGGEQVPAELFLNTLEVNGKLLWQGAVTDVTQWKARQQEALAETEKYKVYIEQSSEGIFCQQFRTPVPIDLPLEQFIERLRADCYISECNTAMARMYGFEEPSGLVGALSGQLLDLSDAANIEYIKSFVANGFRLSDAESHEKDRLGRDKYFLNNIIGIVENDCLTCIWGTQRDITERTETEMKLQESENRFRYIADTAPVMIWICDATNRTIYTSKHWVNFTGVDIVNDPNARWSDAVHGEDVAEAERIFDACFARREHILITYRIRTRDNTYRWVQDTGVPRFLEDGTFIGYIGCIVDIHDTKSKEEQLQQQNVILEQVTDIVITIDLQGKVIGFNHAAKQYFGLQGTDVVGRRASEFVRLNFDPYTKGEVFEVLKKDKRWSGEVSFVNAQGETRYLLHTATNVFNDKGELIGIMSVSHDITDRKLADEKLQQSETFYRSLIADSLDGMLLLDPAGVMTFVSPSIRHILGYEPEEVVGRNAFGFVHPDDLSWAMESFRKELIENPEVKYIVVRLLKKNGEWLWCSIRGHNLLNNPYVNSMAIYFHDDTLRKKASDALKQSEQRFRTLVTELKIGVALFDAVGDLVMCNSTYSALLDCGEEEMLGRQVQDLFPQTYKEDGTLYDPEERPVRLAINTKKPVRDAVMGVDLPHSGERIWLLINIDLVLDEAGHLVQLIDSTIDITERKKLEQRLLDEQINKQKLLTQASIDGQEKERKEIGKELHDNIGQQLTTTKLFLDLAKSTADDTTAEMISMALKGISDVINDVRSMSRSLMPPTLGDLGLMESVSDLVDSISRTQYLRIDLDDYEFDEDKVPDNKKLMIFRIIQEQLNNIVKHAEARQVTIMLRNDKSFLLLEITDDGKGFDPKGVRKGLGLTNMRNRAELFGGEVKIHSAPGQGCTLTVKVPQSLQRIAF